MTTSELRNCFPQLSRQVYGKPLVYLDNAATSLRPRCVVDCWKEVSEVHNANLHRAVHRCATEATALYEQTRDSVKDFIGASDSREIVFTSGATAALNLLAFSLGESIVNQGDEIIIGEAEHHSNIVPWQMMCARKGAVLKVLPVDGRGYPDLEKLKSLMGPRTKVLAIAHISNVLGLTNPVDEIVRICRSNNCISVIDGSQGIVHEKVNVSQTGCDFYVFSGHKIYASPSTGVLYGRKDLLEALPPYMGGGEMIESVSWEKTSYAPVPGRFEAGTQNISGTPTLTPALELAASMRSLARETETVRDYVLEELLSIPGLRLFGDPLKNEDKVPLFSFSVEGAHHEDLALILDKMGIAVRSGQMCAEPLMTRYGVTGMLRASFAPYNTLGEAEYFIGSLRKAIKMLK